MRKKLIKSNIQYIGSRKLGIEKFLVSALFDSYRRAQSLLAPLVAATLLLSGIPILPYGVEALPLSSSEQSRQNQTAHKHSLAENSPAANEQEGDFFEDRDPEDSAPENSDPENSAPHDSDPHDSDPEAHSSDDSDDSDNSEDTDSGQDAEQSARPVDTAQLSPFRAPRLGSGDMPLLRGKVASDSGRSPLLMGSVRQMAPGTKIDLIVPDGAYLNSEVSQKGDEVHLRIAADVKEGNRVILPGGWYVRGLVTNTRSQKRLGRDGYVEIEFDKLVSPDGEYELDFNARFSSKDNKMKSVGKVVAIDSFYIGAGATAGAMISIQWTGIAGAIATEGYSVAIGAGIGASIGAFAALKRKGSICSYLPGDTLRLKTEEAISLPGFDPEMLLSAKPVGKVAGLDLSIEDYSFRKTPWNDKKVRLLELDVDVHNGTADKFNFFDLMVISDHHEKYMCTPFGGFKTITKSVAPNQEGKARLTFTVGQKKRKYSLVYLSRRTGEELTRIPIN